MGDATAAEGRRGQRAEWREGSTRLEGCGECIYGEGGAAVATEHRDLVGAGAERRGRGGRQKGAVGGDKSIAELIIN